MGLIASFKQILSASAFGEVPSVCVYCGVVQAQGRPKMVAGPACWLCEECARDREGMRGSAPGPDTKCSFCGTAAADLAEVQAIGTATICRPCLTLTIQLFNKKGP
jgi:hypothetical protein